MSRSDRLPSLNEGPGTRGLRRAAWLATGLAWFLWIGVEDRGLALVMIVAVAAAIAMTGTAVHRISAKWKSSSSSPVLLGALAGLGGGAAIAPLAALLILIKVSLHAHPLPDFALQDVWAVLRTTPVWIAVGCSAGAGLGLLDGGSQ